MLRKGGSDVSGPLLSCAAGQCAWREAAQIRCVPAVGICYHCSVDDLSPAASAGRLDATQREILLAGPTSFDEADRLPEGLFDYDLSWDGESGEETHLWLETPLGRAVRETSQARSV